MKKLILIILFLPIVANAQVMPANMIYEFSPDSPPAMNVEISNFYEGRTVRVETESIKVIDPKSPNEKHDKDQALLVSPKSFSLGPNEKRVVRLLLKNKPTDHEDTYRVSFLPKSFTDENPEKKKGINLTVLMGAGILVFAPPSNAKTELSWRKEKDAYILKNTGIKNIEINIEAICDKNEENCKESKEGKRLYEGQELKVSAGAVLKISREKITGDSQKLVINTDEGSYTFTD